MLELTLCLDSGDSRPLYRQLYDSLTEQILTGVVAAGERLPGKRQLAEQLAVSVNTVDAAYQMLTAEGYLVSRPRSGFFVLPVEKALRPAAVPPPEKETPIAPAVPFDLTTGSVDTTLFPFRTWARIQRDVLYQQPELLGRGHPQGEPELRQALAEYLGAYRGVRCHPEQIVVGAGVEYLLGLIAMLLRGGMAAVEDPGYHRSRTILENSGVPCRPVSIDGEGLTIQGLVDSGANICYVTPSHHFPTSVTMPVGRRSQLLNWAGQAGRYILEDDYDAEFRFDVRPIPSLQGMAGPEGPVIYLCTFSKSLAPGIRIACMVLPTGLLRQYRATFGSYANTVSRFEQQTLFRFLKDGSFTRHLARMRGAYRRRMEALCVALEQSLGKDRICISGRHTGLHLLLTLKNGTSEADMVERALREGVRLRGLSEYHMTGAHSGSGSTVILGYASLQNEDIPRLAKALRRAWIQ